MRKERMLRSWTQQYVADFIGLSKTAIHDIETCRQKPSYDVLCKLEDLFELNHRQLFAVVDDEYIPSKQE